MSSKLLDAVRKADVTEVEVHLRSSSPDEQDKVTRETAIHVAVRANSASLCRLLVEKGANKEARDRDGRTPLYLAALMGLQDLVQMLVDCGAEVDSCNNWGWSPLMAASVAGHKGCVTFLIQHKANVKVTDTSDWTPLHWLAAKGHTDTMQAMIDAGADLEATDSVGARPLHRAASWGQEGAVKFLLALDPRVDAATPLGHTALHWAARAGYDAIVQLLLDHEASVSAADIRGRQALHEAARGGRASVCQLLLDQGADANARDKASLSPAHCAAAAGHPRALQLLLSHGAKVESVDKSGSTCLHLAAAADSAETVQKLHGLHCSLNTARNDGNTALHVAAGARAHSALQALLDAGADVNKKNKAGQVALGVCDSAEGARLLRDAGAVLKSLSKTDLQRLLHKKFVPETDAELSGLVARGGQRVAPAYLAYRADMNRQEFLGGLASHMAMKGVARVNIKLEDYKRDLPSLHAALGGEVLVTPPQMQQFMQKYRGFMLDEFKAREGQPQYSFDYSGDGSAIELQLRLPAVPFTSAMTDASHHDSRRVQQRVLSEFHRCFMVPRDHMGSFKASVSRASDGCVLAQSTLGPLQQVLIACGMGRAQALPAQRCAKLATSLVSLAAGAVGAGVGAVVGRRWDVLGIVVGALVGAASLSGISVLTGCLVMQRSSFAFKWRFNNEALALAAETDQAPPLQ